MFHSDDDRLREPLDFDHRIGVFLAAAVGYVDDFSLQEIIAMKLRENLRGFRDVNVANLKMYLLGLAHFLRISRAILALSFI